jgi:hypothetical protein
VVKGLEVDQHDHELPGEPPTRLFQIALDDHVVALIDDASDADRAIAELEAEGVPPGDIWRASGEEMRGRLDAAAERETVPHQFGRAITALISDEDRLLSEYLASAGGSGQLIIVRGGQLRRQIEDGLRRHRARDMRYFGDLTIEDLPPG